MKVYLDDERPTPPGWHRCYWPDEVIDLLRAGQISHLSLDHDLGDDDHGTGYDVLLWLEEQVVTNDLAIPSHMQVHSANSSAREKMNRAVGSIRRHATHEITE
jgi:hypothetical protein